MRPLAFIPIVFVAFALELAGETPRPVHRARADAAATLTLDADGVVLFADASGQSLRFDPASGKVASAEPRREPEPAADDAGRRLSIRRGRWRDDAGRVWFVHSSDGDGSAPSGVYRSGKSQETQNIARRVLDVSNALAVAALVNSSRVVLVESHPMGKVDLKYVFSYRLEPTGDVAKSSAEMLGRLGAVEVGHGLALDIEGRVYVPVGRPVNGIMTIARGSVPNLIPLVDLGEPLACVFGIGAASKSLFVRSSEALARVDLDVMGESPRRLRLLRTFREEFLRIRPGAAGFPERFVRGRDDGPAEERPAGEVIMKGEFSIARYEVPQNLWEAVMGANPSRWKGARNSAEMMSWTDATRFCEETTRLLRAASLVEKDELVRLPTETEWEYCARAGTTSIYSFGDDEAKLGDHAWFTGNAKGNDPPVGVKKPNPWGLYDVHGYLWEMCVDAWHPSHEGAPVDGSRRAAKAGETARVARGGSWKDRAGKLTSTFRLRIEESTRDDALGLRCVLAREKSGK